MDFQETSAAFRMPPREDRGNSLFQSAGLPRGFRSAATAPSNEGEAESFIAEAIPRLREGFKRLMDTVKEAVPGWSYAPQDRFVFIEAVRIISDLEQTNEKPLKSTDEACEIYARAEVMLSNSAANLILASRGRSLKELRVVTGPGEDMSHPRQLIIGESPLDQSARLLGNSLLIMSVLLRGATHHERLLQIFLGCIAKERETITQYGPLQGSGLNIGPTLNRFLLVHADVISRSTDRLDVEIIQLLEYIGLNRNQAAICLSELRKSAKKNGKAH